MSDKLVGSSMTCRWFLIRYLKVTDNTLEDLQLIQAVSLQVVLAHVMTAETAEWYSRITSHSANTPVLRKQDGYKADWLQWSRNWSFDARRGIGYVGQQPAKLDCPAALGKQRQQSAP